MSKRYERERIRLEAGLCAVSGCKQKLRRKGARYCEVHHECRMLAQKFRRNVPKKESC